MHTIMVDVFVKTVLIIIRKNFLDVHVVIAKSDILLDQTNIDQNPK